MRRICCVSIRCDNLQAYQSASTTNFPISLFYSCTESPLSESLVLVFALLSQFPSLRPNMSRPAYALFLGPLRRKNLSSHSPA